MVSYYYLQLYFNHDLEIFISGKISDSQDAGRESYQKAIQIEEPEFSGIV